MKSVGQSLGRQSRLDWNEAWKQMSNFQIERRTGRRGLQTKEERKTNWIIWMSSDHRGNLHSGEVRKSSARWKTEQMINYFRVTESNKSCRSTANARNWLGCHVRTRHNQEWMWESGRRRKSFGGSMNRQDPQPFAPCLLLIQDAQRKEDAQKRKRAQVRSWELEEPWVPGTSIPSPKTAGGGEKGGKKCSGGTEKQVEVRGSVQLGGEGGMPGGQGLDPELLKEGMRSMVGRG